MGYFIFWCAPLFCLFPSAMSSHKGRLERREELLVAKLLIANISNIATGMFNKSCWDETGCSVDVWNLFQTQVKPVLVCSVDRATVRER